MERKINKNFSALCKGYNEKYPLVSLCGSSRSGKTYSSIDFIIWLATVQQFKGTLHIVRNTYAGFKTTLYTDFPKRFADFNLPDPIYGRENVKQIQVFGITVHFIGADKVGNALGAGADLVWFNEMEETDLQIFNQKEQRCDVMIWGDYNPADPDHWITTKINKRSDVLFCHSTFIDNPFAPANQVRKIKSYEPTEFNIKEGTADQYNWKVYGLGEYSRREGAIITKWSEGEFKQDLAYVYGMDFGYTQDPTTLVKVAVDFENIYIKLCLYEVGLQTTEIDVILKDTIKEDDLIIADSAEPRLIDELYYKDYNIHGAKKGPDSIKYGLNKILDKNLIISAESDELLHVFRKELNEYVWSNKRANVPIDVHNHAIDAVRYALEELISSEKF